MAEIKKINTELQPIDKLLDTSGDAGTSGQILSTTGSGTNWIDDTGGSVTGTGADEQVTYWTSATVIDGDDGFKYNKGASNNSIITLTSTGLQALSFVDSNSAYADAMSILRDSDKLSLTYGHNANEEAITIVGGTGSDLGFIGIGTTSPQQKLHVYTSSNTVLLVEGNQSTRFATLQLKNAVQSWMVRLEGTSEDFTIRDDTAASEPFRINPATSVGSNDSAIIIDGDANVGIGVSDPDSRLEIKGAGATTGLTLKTTDSSGNTGFWTQDGGATGVHYYPFVVGMDHDDAKPSNTLLYAKTASGSEGGLFVKTDGNVGIGTVLPVDNAGWAGLTLSGTTGGQIDFQDDGTTMGAIYNGTWGLAVQAVAGKELRLYGGGSTTLTLDSSQNATFAGMITVNGGGIDIDNDDDIRLRFDNASVFKAGLQVATTAGDMIASSVINDFAIRAQGNMLFASGGNVEKLKLDTSGNATFAGTAQATTYLVNRTTAAGYNPGDAGIADENSAELGAGYLNLSRSGTAQAYQIVFGKNGDEHSSISTSSTGMIITADRFTVNTDIYTNSLTVDGSLYINDNKISHSGGDITLDAGGDIILDADGADIRFKDAGTEFGRINNNSSGNFLFLSPISDKDIIFKGNDGGSEFVALTLDMSDAGAATFNANVTATQITVPTYFNATSTSAVLGATGSGNIYLRPNGIGQSSGQLHIATSGLATFAGKATSAATITGDGSTTLTTKGYVDGLVTGAATYQGVWDARTAAEGGSGNGGSPDLTASTYKTNGYYFIVSYEGTAYPNGVDGSSDPCPPNSWHVGDWVIWNDDLPNCTGGTGRWQKIDNTSVISGAGTGQKVVKWDGSGVSETLADGPITFSTNDSTFAGSVYAPIYYDSDDTNYYINAGGTSQLTHIWMAGNITNVGNVTATGQVKSLTGWFTDNVYMSGGQLYLGASGSTTDDSYRLAASGGIFTIASRESGTWTTRMDIDTSGDATFAGDVTVNGNLIGKSDNTTEVGTYSTGAIKRIRMAGGGELHFGDTTTSNFLGLTEGAVNSFGDSDRLGLYCRNELKIYGNSNLLKVTIPTSGDITFAEGATFAGNITIDNSSPDLYFVPDASYYSFRVSAQEAVANTFEITPSTAAGGSTYSTPAFSILATNNAATFAGEVSVVGGDIKFVEPNNHTVYIDFARIAANANPTARIMKYEPAATHTSALAFYTSDASGSAPNLVQALLLDQSQDAYFAGAATFAGNVTIGNTTSVQPLTVAGTVLFRTTTGDGFENRFQFIPGGASDAGNFYVYDGAEAVKVRLNAGGDSYLNGGNVGIGTTSPTGGKLQIEGADDTSLLHLSLSGGYSKGSLEIDDPYFVVKSTSNTTGGIKFRTITGGTTYDRMTILNSGNVGIGTTGPDNLLHIANTSGDAILRMSGGGSLGDTYGGFIQGYGVAAQGGKLDLGVIDNSTFKTAIHVGSQSNEIEFSTAGTERMRIDSGGSVIIGDGAPSGTPVADYRSLEIGRQGNTITGAPWKSNLYFSTNATVTAGSTAFTYRYASELPTKMVMEDGIFTFANAVAGTVGNTISFTERMRIFVDGDISMGSYTTTAAPDNGILKIRTADTTTDTCYPLISVMGSTHLADRQYGIGFDPEGYTNRLKMFFGCDGAGLGYSRGDFVWCLENSSNEDIVTPADEKMRLTSSGNVGIGTDSPGSYDDEADNLVVFDATTPGITIATSTTTSRGSLLFADGTSGNERYRGGVIYDHGTGMGGAADTMYLRAAVTGYLALDASGQVGIGTKTPNSELEVVGRVIGSNLVVGPYGSLNDTTGVSGTLQFGNGNTAFVTSSADAYIYKNQSALGTLPVGSLTFQLRSDVTGGAFAFVGQQTPIPLLTIDSSGDSTFAGDVTAQGGTFTQAGGGVQILNNGTAGYNANLFFGKSGGTDGYSIGQGVTANDGVFRIYNNGTASVALAIDNSDNATFAGVLYGPGGSKGAPTYSFTSDTNTGMYSGGADTIAFTAGDNTSLVIGASSVTVKENLVLDSNANIVLDTNLSGSSGTIIKIGTGTLTAGVCYMMQADKSWFATDIGDEEFSRGLIAIALGSGASAATDDGMLINGIFYDASHSFTIGLPLFLTGDAGALSNTAPSASGDLVRVVGYAVNDDEIYFCPDNTWVILD